MEFWKKKRTLGKPIYAVAVALLLPTDLNYDDMAMNRGSISLPCPEYVMVVESGSPFDAVL